MNQQQRIEKYTQFIAQYGMEKFVSLLHQSYNDVDTEADFMNVYDFLDKEDESLLIQFYEKKRKMDEMLNMEFMPLLNSQNLITKLTYPIDNCNKDYLPILDTLIENH
jgi:hypothetical protein